MVRERESRDIQVENSRPKRVPLHEQKRSILTASNRDQDYIYRFVNDVLNPDGSTRIESFKLAGYDVVENPNVKIGDVDGDTSLGSTAVANVGQGRKAVLMRIKKDIYDADQKAKQAKITAAEVKTVMRRPVKATDTEDGNYGEVSISKR